MSLITCPECGRENVSDSAITCPQCGFCIKEYFLKQNISIQIVTINGVEYDVTELQQAIKSDNRTYARHIISKLLPNINALGIDIIISDIVRNNNNIPPTFQLDDYCFDNKVIEAHVPKCPTCGSPQVQKIGTLDRLTSVGFFGLGSKKLGKSMLCKNCGYTW